jgi:hypothetical protein
MKTGHSTVHLINHAVMQVLVMTLIVCAFCFTAQARESSTATTRPPFTPGERLSFVLSWSGIPAGKATLEVLPMADKETRPAYHFRMTAESNAFVDVFYKVRDRIDSYVDPRITRSLRYLKKQHEGSRRRDIVVEFDPAGRSAHYKDEKRNKTISLKEGTFDPLGIFYYARTQPLAPGHQIQRRVTDGLKNIMGRARIVSRQKITVIAGTFDTLLMEPEMEHIGGVFEKSKGAKIRLWVTDDARRIPVKIASKVVVGSFVGELAAIE